LLITGILSGRSSRLETKGRKSLLKRPKIEDLIPTNWYQRGRLKREWRKRVPRKVWVFPDGRLSTTEIEGAIPMWWQEEGFWICPRCGENYTARENGFSKLASLSSEGRSSATTILATAFLRHAKSSKLTSQMLVLGVPLRFALTTLILAICKVFPNKSKKIYCYFLFDI